VYYSIILQKFDFSTKQGKSEQNFDNFAFKKSEQKSIRGGLRGFTPVFLKVIVHTFETGASPPADLWRRPHI
jgi:hypothetical protein